jgi:hypothetical protein
MLGRDVATTRDRATAIRRCAALVSTSQESDADFWAVHLNGQIFLGDEAFRRARAPARSARAVGITPGACPSAQGLAGRTPHVAGKERRKS